MEGFKCALAETATDHASMAGEICTRIKGVDMMRCAAAQHSR